MSDNALAKKDDKIGSTAIQIKRTSTGELQAVKGVVNLSLQRKEIVNIKGTMSITAIGYDRLNQVSGLSLVLPKRIEVPRYGQQPNPFFVINDKTGGIQFVMAKMSAVGHSPIGSICVVDQTLLFDLQAYFKMDAIAKIKSNRGLGKIANKQMLTDEELTHGLFLPVLDENFGVWLDSRHDEFMKLLSEQQQRQRFAERIALGILKRNCLRHHPAIATSVVQPQGGEAAVTVIGHRHELSEDQVRDIVEGERGPEIETIEKEIHTDTIDPDDMLASTSDSKVIEGEVEAPVELPSNELTDREKMMIRINEMKNIMGESEYKTFYDDMVPSGRELSEFGDDELKRYANLMEKNIEETSQ